MTTLATIDISFIISTHNRCGVLLDTLRNVYACGLASERFEVFVVDNASSDGTAQAVAKNFTRVNLICLAENLGSCAKNLAVKVSRGEYVVFLDDDSFPLPGSVEKMIAHFQRDPKLGAATFTITLPDESRECSAFPDVFIGCGVGFRRAALVGAGGLPDNFFMQAEEYDLSLRLLDAGWRVKTFEDLHVRHLKTPNARRSWRTTRLDVRNNFLVATKYLPDACAETITLDWMRRYYRIAAGKNQRSAFVAGLLQGATAALKIGHRQPVRMETAERFFRAGQIENQLAAAQKTLGLRRIVFLDYGKNIHPHWQAAKKLGIDVIAVADDCMRSGLNYRGAPIVSDVVARKLQFDAAIVSNSSPVHAQARRLRWMQIDDRPVIDLLAQPLAA